MCRMIQETKTKFKVLKSILAGKESKMKDAYEEIIAYARDNKIELRKNEEDPWLVLNVICKMLCRNGLGLDGLPKFPVINCLCKKVNST